MSLPWLTPLALPGLAEPLPVEIVNPEGYDWGNALIQVLIAAATIAALIWAIRVGQDEASRAHGERVERLAFEERAQATSISAWERQWVEQRDGSPLPRFEDYGPDVPYDVVERRSIYAHNGSNAPAYDVVIRYIDTSSVRDDSQGDLRDLQQAWLHQVLPPAPEPRELDVPRTTNCGALSEDVILEIEFRDAAGRYWLRDSEGILHRRSDLDALTSEQRQDRLRAEIEHDFGAPAEAQ